MVTDGVSQTRGYTTEGKHEEAKLKEDKCFTAKPVSEKISDCDQLI